MGFLRPINLESEQVMVQPRGILGWTAPEQCGFGIPFKTHKEKGSEVPRVIYQTKARFFLYPLIVSDYMFCKL